MVPRNNHHLQQVRQEKRLVKFMFVVAITGILASLILTFSL